MSSDQQSTVEIGRFGLAIWRRWRVIALCVVSVFVLACGWLVVAPTSATATTEVNVNVISTDPFSAQRTSSDLIDPATERQLLQSSDVLERAADKLGHGATARSVRAGLEAEMVAGSTVMRIRWTGSSGKRAQEVADTLAEEYLTYRSELAGSRQEEALAPLLEQRDALKAQLEQAKTGRTALVNELNLVVSQITKVSSLATTGGTVLARAADSTPSVRPRATQVLAVALALGLLLGVVGVVVADIVRRRVYDASDVGAAGGGVLLAALRARSRAELSERHDRDALQTAWHRLRVKIADDVPVMLVIGASPGAPTSDVAHALEAAAAQVDETSPQPHQRPRAVAVPSDEGYAVALSLAPRATVVVLAAETGRTTVRQLATLAGHLAAIDVEVAGTVVAHRFAGDDRRPAATLPRGAMRPPTQRKAAGTAIDTDATAAAPPPRDRSDRTGASQ